MDGVSEIIADVYGSGQSCAGSAASMSPAYHQRADETSRPREFTILQQSKQAAQYQTIDLSLLDVVLGKQFELPLVPAVAASLR